MELAEELKYLRKKVNKLESTIQFIQNELQNKLGSVLERFFDQRASKLAKQRKAIQIEEDFCLDLLSCCADLQEADSFTKDKEYIPRTITSKRPVMKTESADPGQSQRKKRIRRKKLKEQTIDYREESNDDDDAFGNISNSNDSNNSDGEVDYATLPSAIVDTGMEIIPDELIDTTEDMSELPAVIGIKKEAVDIQDPDYPTVQVKSCARARNRKPKARAPRKSTNYEEVVDLESLTFIEVDNFQSHVWTYFLREEHGRYAKCKDCYRIFKTDRGSTTILHGHVRFHSNIDSKKKAGQVIPDEEPGTSFTAAKEKGIDATM